MTRASDGDTAPQPAKYLASHLTNDEARHALQQVDETLGTIIERYGGASAVAGAELMQHWPELGGDEWGERGTPASLKDGVLVVEVPSGGDAALAKYDEAAIRARIRARYGPDLVRSIRFRVGRGT